MTVGFVLRRVDCNDGVASHLETLMRGLAADGVKIVLLTGPIHRRGEAAARYDSLASLASKWIELYLPVNQRPVTWRAVNQLSEAIQKYSIQLLHLHGVSTLPLARLAVGTKKIPIVATAHPSGTSVRGPNGLSKRVIWLSRTILRRMYLPDQAIAISTDLRDWFVNDLCMEAGHVQRIFHGVDALHFRPPIDAERRAARDFFNLPKSAVVITLLGRYEPVKRHDVLIDAIKQIADYRDGLHVLLVGAGGYEHRISEMVVQSGLHRRIHMHRAILDARTAYWASDIAVLPSDREGFGLAIAEAMLCGVVPVRTNTAGAYDQITDGRDGYIFPAGDVRKLAQILQHLYDNLDLIRTMGVAAARSAREKFDSSLMAERTLQVYRSLISLEDCPPSERNLSAVSAK